MPNSLNHHVLAASKMVSSVFVALLESVSVILALPTNVRLLPGHQRRRRRVRRGVQLVGRVGEDEEKGMARVKLELSRLILEHYVSCSRSLTISEVPSPALYGLILSNGRGNWRGRRGLSWGISFLTSVASRKPLVQARRGKRRGDKRAGRSRIVL